MNPNGNAGGSEAPNDQQGKLPTDPTPTPPEAPAPHGDEQVANPAAKKYAEEAAAARKTVRELEAKLAELTQADEARKLAELTDTQRAQAEAETHRTRAEALAKTLLERDIAEAANKAGITAPDLAAMAIAPNVKLDAKGIPTNLDELMKTFVEAHPQLIAPTPGSNQGRANPGRDSGQPTGRVYTTDELSDYAFWTEHKADIDQAMREGRIRSN